MEDDDDDDDDDDDMADLFSFGTEEAVLRSHDASAADAATTATATPTSSALRTRAGSSDSFLDLLDSETGDIMGIAELAAALEDAETQEILNWLEEDGKELEQLEQLAAATGSGPGNSTPQPQPATPPTPLTDPTVVTLPPVFESLNEALKSTESTVSQIRELATTQALMVMDPTLRPELYCRMICHKTCNEVSSSSLADSFEAFVCEHANDAAVPNWMTQRSEQLAPLIRKLSRRSATECQDDFKWILLYHIQQYQQQPSPSAIVDDDETVACVAALLLCTMPRSTASTVLTQLIPHTMPLLALPPSERWEAALSLHQLLYLLANYHLPLLVFHLDRYLPGWYWPVVVPSSSDDDSSSFSSVTQTSRHLQRQGRIPLSLLTAMAPQPNENMLQVWDRSFVIAPSTVAAMRFFLVLTVLEHAADELLLLTGMELKDKFQHVLQLNSNNNNNVDEWWQRAVVMQLWTPESVWRKLKQAEDEAFQTALQQRQQRTQAEIKARLEAEAAAHREAQEKKAEEARLRLNRAKLVAFYRKHAPDKEGNIDKIMETYAGQFEVLDNKLRLKYGEGFNPALPKASAQGKTTNMVSSTRSQGVSGGKKREGDEDTDAADKRLSDQVSVLVAAAEVLPAVCWSREAAASRGQERRRRLTDRKQLKFFLVDSRSEDAAAEQGRFPTAFSLSPEAMMDPDRLKENEEVFEALRGTVHIVVMGEGFAALPDLYNHKLTPKLEEMMEQEESRTNICALFFVKKGFPFVSILNGGFAAAHSWLVREGPGDRLTASEVLVDYDADGSLFGQLETLHNASATEKAQRKMQNLLDKSLIAMTKRAQQLERLASEYESNDSRKGLRRSLFGLSEPVSLAREGMPSESGNKGGMVGVARTLSNDGVETLRTTQIKEGEPSSNGTESPPPSAVEARTPPESSQVSTKENATNREATRSTTSPTLPTEGTGQNRSGVSRGKVEAAPSAQSAGNMFKGFGAAINQSIKSVQEDRPNMLKRNPFAMFGAAAGATSAGGGGGGGSGGWNQLRKTAMARMASSGPAEVSATDEEVSFASVISGSAEAAPTVAELPQAASGEPPQAHVKSV